MTRAQLLALCTALPGAYLDTPWEGDEVAKVGGKIFCFFSSPGQPVSITVKNTAEMITEWRARLPEQVSVPRYLAKHLWNSVLVDGLDDDELSELIEDSYDLVVATLPRAKRP